MKKFYIFLQHIVVLEFLIFAHIAKELSDKNIIVGFIIFMLIVTFGTLARLEGENNVSWKFIQSYTKRY